MAGIKANRRGVVGFGAVLVVVVLALIVGGGFGVGVREVVLVFVSLWLPVFLWLFMVVASTQPLPAPYLQPLPSRILATNNNGPPLSQYFRSSCRPSPLLLTLILSLTLPLTLSLTLTPTLSPTLTLPYPNLVDLLVPDSRQEVRRRSDNY